MIKILGRYIAKTIMQATGLATLIITGVLLLISLLGELKDMGEGDYGISQVFLYVFLLLPNALYHFSPMLILVGTITGLSTLSTHRELTVMRASGVSIRRIIYSVFIAAFFMILAISLIGEGVAPHLSYTAEVRKENAQNGGQAVVTASGVWFHVDNNFIHIQHVVGRELLEGVTRYEFDDKHHLLAAYYAKRLSFENDQWQMYDGVKTTFYNERTKSQSFPQAKWDLKSNTNLLNVGLVAPSEMSLHKLSKFSHYLEQNGLQASEYRFEFWERIFQPLASLVMILLAIPFVLGAPTAPMMGWRIVAGILMSFAFFISNAFLGELCIVYQFPAVLAAFLPPLIFAVFGVFLSKRMIRR